MLDILVPETFQKNINGVNCEYVRRDIVNAKYITQMKEIEKHLKAVERLITKAAGSFACPIKCKHYAPEDNITDSFACAACWKRWAYEED